MTDVEQFLTGKFQLWPSRRKAASLERVLVAAETSYWRLVEAGRPVAEAAVSAPEPERRKALDALSPKALRGMARQECRDHSLLEAIAALKSYVELKAGNHTAESPPRSVMREQYHVAVLNAFAASVLVKEGNAAVGELARVARLPDLDPSALAARSDGLALRECENGHLLVPLNIVRKDEATCEAALLPEVGAATGEAEAKPETGCRACATNPIGRHGMCRACYLRMARARQRAALKGVNRYEAAVTNSALLKKIMRQAARARNGCLLWQGTRTKGGYGVVQYGGWTLLAHRLTAMASGRATASDPCVLHVCDTPACIEPSHLKGGTHRENLLDKVAKGRVRFGGGRPSKPVRGPDGRTWTSAREAAEAYHRHEVYVRKLAAAEAKGFCYLSPATVSVTRT